jgi:hypothetical protein
VEKEKGSEFFPKVLHTVLLNIMEKKWCLNTYIIFQCKSHWDLYAYIQGNVAEAVKAAIAAGYRPIDGAFFKTIFSVCVW